MLEGFGGTVEWVSQDRGEVFRNCRRGGVLEAGRSQGTYSLRELFHNPETEAAARLSGCKNFVEASAEDGFVLLPRWGLRLKCGKEIPQGMRCVGVRAHHVQVAEAVGENTFPCTVERVIQDVFSTIVILRPNGAEADAPALRMELNRERWHQVPDKRHLLVTIEPRDILLLK